MTDGPRYPDLRIDADEIRRIIDRLEERATKNGETGLEPEIQRWRAEL